MRLIIYAFLILTFNLFSQNEKIDSLINLILHDKEDTLMVYHLNKLCIEHYYKGDLNKCIAISQKIISISQKINYTRGLYSAHDNLGSIYNELNNIPEALKNHYLALEICKKTSNKKDLALINCNISSALINNGRHSEASPYCYTSLKIFKELKLSTEISNAYNNIGIIYFNSKKYNLAMGYFKLALREAQITNSEYYIASSYLSLGNIYREFNNNTIALDSYNKALKYYENLNNEYGISLCCNNISLVHYAQKDLNKAEQLLKSVIERSKKNNDVESLADSYLYYTKIDSTRSDYLSAYQHHKQHISYRDSLINKESIEKSIQTKMQYEFDKKQLLKDAELKEKQLKLNGRRNNIITSVIGITIILISMFVYKNLKQKQLFDKLSNQQLALEKQLTENEINLLRLQINPHLIFNTLNSINAFITSNLNADAEKYLIKFSKLLRSTLNQSANTFISLQEELNTLTDYIELEQLRLNQSFTCQINIDENVNTSNKMPPLILQPFVENAILHGLKHKTDKNGLLNITVKENNDLLLFTITDNGIGRKQAEYIKAQKKYQHTSKGIAITTQRIELLKKNHSMVGIVIHDLINDVGVVLGTEVIICIPVMG